MKTYYNFVCKKCNKEFSRTSKNFGKNGKLPLYCSHECFTRDKSSEMLSITCGQCENIFFRKLSQLDISKSGKNFCSQSCAALYNNAHKTHGIRRSKLEIYLEKELTNIYPFEIIYNGKTTIKSELDIYIPSLKLAFELNGIFHYEPIYGSDKLDRQQNNDNRKFQACLEKDISLCIIDTSGQKNFNQKSSKQYLDIILSVIQKVINDTQYPMSDLN